MTAFTNRFAAFISASPSSFHAAAEVARQLGEAGWTAANLGADTLPERGFVVRDGAVVAWVQPPAIAPDAAFRIIGTHTDSPGFVAKPNATLTQSGYRQVGVEVYGGPILASWLDRELELAGRLVNRSGEEALVRSGPALRIPHLAIHLDRDVNAALTLDKQRHMQPVWGVGDDGDIIADLAATIGWSNDDVAGADLITVATEAPAVFGRGGELFASGRLDNLSSTYAALAAFLDGEFGSEHTSIFVAFNHEEVGSETRAGACGPLLEEVLDALADARGASAANRRAALAASWLVSADAGHGIHPNFPEKHDPVNRPVLGGGPLLKMNANQRYASDAHGNALWARLCAAAGVDWQPFVSHNDVPCGSTIGPLAATRLGIRTVDVGVPLLSMHSARELCHVNDVPALSAALAAFTAGS